MSVVYKDCLSGAGKAVSYLNRKTIIIREVTKKEEQKDGSTKTVIDTYNSAYLGDRLIGIVDEDLENNLVTSTKINTDNSGTIYDQTKNSKRINERGSGSGDAEFFVEYNTFDPNSVETGIGSPDSVYTPWDGNNWDSSVVSNVDSQDDKLLDDITKDNADEFGTAFGNSASNFVSNKIGIVKDIKNLTSDDGGHTSVPNGTEYDTKFDNQLKKIKSERYRNIKLNAVNGGTYNSLYNLLGIASGIFVGSLGKSSTSQMIDDMTSKFTGGFGIAGMLERGLTGGLSSLPSLEEIIELNTITMNTMYEAKPGRRVADKNHKYNFITNNLVDGLDGSIGEEDGGKTNIQGRILRKLNNVSGKVSSAIDNYGTISAWQSKLIGLITNKTNRIKGSSKDYGLLAEGKTVIISEQRDDSRFVQYVGDLYDYKNGRASGNKSNKSSRIRIGINPNDFVKDKNLFDKTYSDLKMLNGEGKTRFDVFNRVNFTFGNFAGLYVEPYNNIDKKLEPFYIPFEFNPKITEGGLKANYATQELMGRILSVRSYVGSDVDSLTLETDYIATCVNKDLGGTENDIKDDYWLNGWMKNWDIADIQRTERLYRALVLPYIEGNNFVRPPIVRIKMGKLGEDSIDTVGDLFKYPNIENKIQVTKALDGKETREKRYIVTDVNISKISDDWGMNYVNPALYDSDIRIWKGTEDVKTDDENYTTKDGFTLTKANAFFRYSFRVTLTLAETTKNFLDQIPSYSEYVNKVTNNLPNNVKQEPEKNNSQPDAGFNFNDNFDYIEKLDGENEEKNIFKAMYELNKS